MNQQQSNQSFLTIPSAIVIAGAIIAISIIWINKPIKNTNDSETKAGQQTTQNITINLSPVTTNDHILGNPNASIKIIVYSDPSCPYCKIFSPIMSEIMKKYGPTGNVAEIYRHYPLDKPDASGNILHPNAGNESQALECVASLGDNDKFWAYENKMYSQNTTGTEGLNQKLLPIMAKDIGIDISKFNECLKSGKSKEKVEADYTSGVNAGISGTPTSFFVLDKPISDVTEKYITDLLIQYRIPKEMLLTVNDRKVIVMSGALPKQFVSGLIDILIRN